MEITPEQGFRRAMGAFATGVTVVSAARADGALSGITVNSMTSVSLQPRLLLWCLGYASARYDIFSEAEAWGVTMLGANEEALAMRFTRVESESISPDEADWFEGAPVLKAGMAHLSCRTREQTVAGDHLIIVGEVIDFRVRPGPALTFYRGRYGRIEDPNGSES